jgi:hypothetical protein
MVRIETLKSLTDDEMSMLLYILNTEPPLPITEVTPRLILSYKTDALTWKLSQWRDKVKDEYIHIFDQLMFKISNPRLYSPSNITGSSSSNNNAETTSSLNNTQ